MVLDNLLLDHVGLIQVLVLAVHLVHNWGVVGWVANVIIVSAQVQRIGFLGFLDLV